MCSVLDQQLEFVPSKITIDETFIMRKVHRTWIYCEEVISSDRSAERKKELMGSAIGGLASFLKHCTLSMPLALTIAVDCGCRFQQLHTFVKPKSKMNYGTQDSKVPLGNQSDSGQVGEQGMEIQSLESNRVDITHHIRSDCWGHRRPYDGFEGYLRDHQGV